MVDIEWFKIKSWHAVKQFNNFVSRANIDFTVASAYCGRKIDYRTDAGSPLLTEFPEGEKTCESCLRFLSLEGRV